MRFNKPCLDCGTLSRNNRCEKHQQLYKQKRNEREAPGGYRATKKAALYNSTYRKQAKHIRQTATVCALCGEGARPNDPFEADHVIPGGVGSPLQPAHRTCNQRKSNKKNI